jgi:hypothetical protein
MARRTRHLEANDTAVGIDLASEKHVVVLLSAQGQRLTRFSIPHSREGMEELIRRCAPERWKRPGARAIFAFEATGHI